MQKAPERHVANAAKHLADLLGFDLLFECHLLIPPWLIHGEPIGTKIQICINGTIKSFFNFDKALSHARRLSSLSLLGLKKRFFRVSVGLEPIENLQMVFADTVLAAVRALGFR